MKRNLVNAAIAASLMATSVLFAEDQATKVLSDLHHANQTEIHMGMMAKEKSQNADVKVYGEQLMKDHKDADAQVLAVAKAQGIQLDEASGEGMMAKHNDHEAKEAMDELSAKSGADFDRAFNVNALQGAFEDIGFRPDIRKLQAAGGCRFGIVGFDGQEYFAAPGIAGRNGMIGPERGQDFRIESLHQSFHVEARFRIGRGRGGQRRAGFSASGFNGANAFKMPARVEAHRFARIF